MLTRPSPCDFFLFLKLKGVMKETCFLDVEAIKTVMSKELRAIPDRSFQEYMAELDGEVRQISRLLRK